MQQSSIIADERTMIDLKVTHPKIVVITALNMRTDPPVVAHTKGFVMIKLKTRIDLIMIFTNKVHPGSSRSDENEDRSSRTGSGEYSRHNNSIKNDDRIHNDSYKDNSTDSSHRNSKMKNEYRSRSDSCKESSSYRKQENET